MRVRIRENSWLAAIAAKKLGTGQVAMVLGRTIHLSGVSRDEFLRNREWVCHELKHVEQFREHGVVLFLLRYLIESARCGYEQNRFEVAARNSENDRTLLEKARFS